MNELKLNETVAFNHDGVKIRIKLDYENRIVDFLDNDGEVKRWKFCGRGRDYLGGWMKIMEAMKAATVYADARLKEQEEIREKLQDERFADLAIALGDIE